MTRILYKFLKEIVYEKMLPYRVRWLIYQIYKKRFPYVLAERWFEKQVMPFIGDFKLPADVLHIVPHTVGEEQYRFHGSTKDVRNREEYFADRGLTSHRLFLPRVEGAAIQVLKMINRKYSDLSKYKTVIFDIPGSYPRILRHLKKVNPNATLIFRSHNAEFFHRLDWMEANDSYSKKWDFFKRALKGAWGDFQTVQICDYVSAISSWDNHFYWKRLALTSHQLKKIVLTPYFYPSRTLPVHPVGNWETKPNNVVCMGMAKAKESPLIRDSIEVFNELVTDLTKNGAIRWNFLYTGSVPSGLELCPEIQTPGFVPDPNELMKDAKALCIMSDLGRGFKTKILDAILHQCWVILPKDSYYRLPVEVMPYCIPFDLEKDSFEQTLERIDRPFPQGFDLNQSLRTQAYRGLDQMIFPKNKRLKI